MSLMDNEAQRLTERLVEVTEQLATERRAKEMAVDSAASLHFEVQRFRALVGDIRAALELPSVRGMCRVAALLDAHDAQGKPDPRHGDDGNGGHG